MRMSDGETRCEVKYPMKPPKVFLTASTIVFTCALFNAQLSYASNRTYKNLPSYRSLYRSPQELLSQSAAAGAVPTRAASSTPAVTRDSNGGVTVRLGVRNIREANGITIPTEPQPVAAPHPLGTPLPAHSFHARRFTLGQWSTYRTINSAAPEPQLAVRPDLSTFPGNAPVCF